ncbi:hypothetical protein [Anthocerotibacter panamensis]|uniref:hypothetical protein n=1 Tax=Anthocerotibacter panamensis TaxID=2857077 RepID=UPI001C404502|nr:hypothetical protein [Anthocerotibacter panamensis]
MGYWLKLECPWLRWFDQVGQWIPTPEEREAQAHQQAEQLVETERRHIALLVEQLQALGVDPDLL